MDARELMVGNYYDHNGELKEVTPNTILDIWESKRTWCKPIPLNEDWLVKLGFEKYHPDKFTKGPMVITLYEHGCLYLANQRHVNFHYVHQLQNLYFALTGQELTLANEGRRDV